ncbi:Hpt domain-containing protein [Oligoflexus tunisiensis]|uniref:Hpt domain-containing protein n=1 Tax=Oligoflexus tunisiensis TaxID=708132 RepID=UPI000AD77BAC|nr:Hpt domain-containing protein [Oligoflexus tunisiensis]
MKRILWLIIRVGCLGLGGTAEAARPPVFEQPWYLTEDEPAAWSRDEALVQPERLTGWKPYQAATVPPGINKTIWLWNVLPAIPDQRHVLYFANGLEDIAVYINGELVYSYGSFRKAWDEVSPQVWHAIPLGPEHSHQRLEIRTHYALSYVMRTLYPVIRLQSEALGEHTGKSIPLIYLAGAFGLMGLVVLAVALMRRQVDLFLYFALMSISVSSWVLFNQDSLIKPYTGLPPRSWSYFDLVGIYLSAACLVSFLSIVAQSRSRLIRFVFWLNWGMAFTVAVASGFGGIHAWYLLPLLHIAVFPSLLGLIPLIIWSAFHRNTEARVLMVGSLAMALSAVHDIVRYSANFRSPITTMIPIGGLVTLLAMLLILVRRYQAEREDAFQTQAKLLTDIQSLNAALQVHVEKVEALVEEKTREIGSILGHIQQGIFMLTGPDLLIHAEYSEHLETILGTPNIAGQSFEQTVLDRCRLGADQRSRMIAALQASLGEDSVNFEVNASNLPTEVYLTHGHEEKILELSWAAIADDRDVIDKILITARDVTSLRQLQSDARRNQEEMKLLQIILSAKPERFLRFLDSSLQLISKAREAPGQPAGRSLRTAFRDLHTVKGNARSFGLDELASLIHDAELILQNNAQENLELRLQQIQSKIESYKALFHRHIQGPAGQDRLTAVRQKLEEVLLEKNPVVTQRLRRLEEVLLPEVFIPAETLFREVCQGLGKLAKDLGKHRPEVILESHGIYLTQSTADLLTDCLGHLLRNAIDHGIESPEERIAAGKTPQGRLYFQCQREGENLRIHLHDDGHGLHLQKILARAYDRGLLRVHERLTAARLEQLIFSPGFSTKAEASLVSGRGVGLDAVRAALEQKGARIRLHFMGQDEAHEGMPFSFEMLLPATCWIEAPHTDPVMPSERAS